MLLLLCRGVPLQDCELLDLAGRPEHLLMTTLPVPPVCIRPRLVERNDVQCCTPCQQQF